MKKLNTSAISVSRGLPLKSGTFDHIQSAYQEGFASAIKERIPNYSTSEVYILHGCTVTDNGGGNYTISAGAVFYNGEIYQVDSVTLGTPTTGFRWVGNIVTTYLTSSVADPVTYTDSTTGNIHEIRKMVISIAATGSGVKNFDAFTPLLKAPEFTTADPYTSAIRFNKNAVYCGDIQSTQTNILFDYDFGNAIVGAQFSYIFDPDPSSCTLTFSSVPGDHYTMVMYGQSDSMTVSDPSGNKIVCVTLTYMGQEANYGNHLVKADIYQ